MLSHSNSIITLPLISSASFAIWIYRALMHRSFVGRCYRCIRMGRTHFKARSMALYLFRQLVRDLSFLTSNSHRPYDSLAHWDGLQPFSGVPFFPFRLDVAYPHLFQTRIQVEEIWCAMIFLNPSILIFYISLTAFSNIDERRGKP